MSTVAADAADDVLYVPLLSRCCPPEPPSPPAAALKRHARQLTAAEWIRESQWFATQSIALRSRIVVRMARAGVRLFALGAIQRFEAALDAAVAAEGVSLVRFVLTSLDLPAFILHLTRRLVSIQAEEEACPTEGRFGWVRTMVTELTLLMTTSDGNARCFPIIGLIQNYYLCWGDLYGECTAAPLFEIISVAHAAFFRSLSAQNYNYRMRMIRSAHRSMVLRVFDALLVCRVYANADVLFAQYTRILRRPMLDYLFVSDDAEVADIFRDSPALTAYVCKHICKLQAALSRRPKLWERCCAITTMHAALLTAKRVACAEDDHALRQILTSEVLLPKRAANAIYKQIIAMPTHTQRRIVDQLVELASTQVDAVVQQYARYVIRSVSTARLAPLLARIGATPLARERLRQIVAEFMIGISLPRAKRAALAKWFGSADEVFVVSLFTRYQVHLTRYLQRCKQAGPFSSLTNISRFEKLITFYNQQFRNLMRMRLPAPSADCTAMSKVADMISILSVLFGQSLLPRGRSTHIRHAMLYVLCGAVFHAGREEEEEEGETEGEARTCGVCYEGSGGGGGCGDDGGGWYRMPCSHAFHIECLQDLVQHGHARGIADLACPYCTANFLDGLADDEPDDAPVSRLKQFAQQHYCVT